MPVGPALDVRVLSVAGDERPPSSVHLTYFRLK